MKIKIDSLISFDKIKNDADEVFEIVDRNGNVILIKNNQTAYVISKYDVTSGFNIGCLPRENSTDLTLHEAIKIVLLAVDNNTMHASKLADEIYNRRLYLKRNGDKAQYNQIQLRSRNHPDIFETLPGNFIKLRET